MALLLAWSTAVTRADVILDWNALMIDGIRTDNSGPTLSTRNLAILHTAIYDAVNGIVRSHQPYRIQLDPPPAASAEAAAVGAAYAVMSVLYPSLRARSDDLYGRFLAAAPSAPDSGEARSRGLAYGEEIAGRMLASRAADGSQTEVPYIPSDAPGQWRRTPPFFRPPLTPHWRHVDPFCVPDVESFLPPPPPALDSVWYANALNEVKTIGSRTSSVRTPEQGQIAVFWSDFSYTSMPPGHWHLIAASIARDRGNTLVENARMFALMSLAQADAAIVCWETKFRHNLWRPVTAIQRADEDGNPLTDADPAWEQLLPSPPFPAYSSGHSTFSKASAQVLTHFYATDAITFIATSDSLPGVYRTFHSLSECADEIGMSRIYGGFHYSFDNVQGKASGGRIGDHVYGNYLLPLDSLPVARLERRAEGHPGVRVHAGLGQAWKLEACDDLGTWATIATGTGVLGGTLVTDPAAAAASCRFYRVSDE